MNGIPTLPGLLDDPQFQLPDLPALTDFHIAPLRDPAPLRHNNAPLPLEPLTANAVNASHNVRHGPQLDGIPESRRTPNITPNDVLQARESKKPHLAISEIIEHDDSPDSQPVHLPSFVSLSFVEKSPVQASLAITSTYPFKRPRLDQDADLATHDFGRQLPRPAHKEKPHSRPAPLLPAMVTGLHEPPPSAALLPSMDLDQPPVPVRTPTAKIQVKDMLMNNDHHIPLSTKLPPLQKQNTEISLEQPTLKPLLSAKISTTPSTTDAKESKDGKIRRARRKWTENETQDLLRGVDKYGVGKWKQILEDPTLSFNERTTVDLKDRYRVSGKDKDELNMLDSSEPLPSIEEPPTKGDANTYEAVTIATPNGQAMQRRKRRAWTAGEDERLTKGILKHGLQWTNIHDDPELDLGHRRATDLRDRVRNKYPEGYKHAESAPLRSEVKKARESKIKAGKKRGSSELNGSSEDILNGKEKEKDQFHAGLKLPSLTFDDDDDMDWDNRLAPLIEWEDLNNMGV